MDAGLKRDVPSFEDSGGEFSVVKDLTLLLYAKRKKSQAAYAKSVDGGEYDNNKHHRRGDAHRKRAGIRRAFSLGAHGG